MLRPVRTAIRIAVDTNGHPLVADIRNSIPEAAREAVLGPLCCMCQGIDLLFRDANETSSGVAVSADHNISGGRSISDDNVTNSDGHTDMKEGQHDCDVHDDTGHDNDNHDNLSNGSGDIAC